jgi:hypothetical protein
MTTTRRVFLLSPYRLPTTHQVLLGQDEMAAWLNGYVVMWHPALVLGCDGPPKVDSPYDHDRPEAGFVYVRPESPPLFLPDDWEERVRQAGAVTFLARPDRGDTLADLRQALGGEAQLAALDAEIARPFFGIGFAYLVIETLFDAMEHEHLLDAEGLWREVRSAAEALAGGGTADAAHPHLKAAAEKLQAAREVLYPMTVHLLDLAMPGEREPDAAIPTALERGSPLNVLASAAVYEQFGRDNPDRLQRLRDRASPEIQPPVLEVCGGCRAEREDAVLPVESQLWNLRNGKARTRELTGADVQVYARKRSAYHPQLPLLLQTAGIPNAVQVAFDGALVPNHHATVINWPSPDGKQVTTLTRTPHAGHQAQTYFNLGYHLHQAITQDTAPTIAIVHTEKPLPLYEDWLSLTPLAPALGQWTTLSRYLSDALAGSYAMPSGADEFFADYLDERHAARLPDPVSAFARHARLRRRVDAAYTLAALHRALVPARPDDAETALLDRLAAEEERLESRPVSYLPGTDPASELAALEKEFAGRLAERLQARAAPNRPGFLFLNPCGFTRRIAVELEGVRGPLPVEGPLKAAQFDGDKAKLVVEVPPLGFAWVPREGPAGTPAPRGRLRLADGNVVRNEYIEAEIDPVTGGLKSLRDPRTQVSRLGQQLVYNPGSTMRAKTVQVTSAGPALGEIVSEGSLLDEQGETLATFRQRFRAWLGRPVIDMRIEIFPRHEAAGYPWHGYYGARFAWRDERATLLRGVNGSAAVTTHPRPVSPDYLEIRLASQRTLIFPGGLPFHLRQGGRMLDVVLVPEHETGRGFDLALAVDRDNPMQTTLGTVSPIPMVASDKGPPHVGPSGWLFHLDAPNLLLTSLRPTTPPEGAGRSVVAHLLECSGFAGSAELRCVYDPSSAATLDGSDAAYVPLSITGDAVSIDFAANDLIRVRVDWA